MMDWFIILSDYVAHKCVEEIVNVEEKQGAAMTLHYAWKTTTVKPRYEMSWTAFPVGLTRKYPRHQLSYLSFLMWWFFSGADWWSRNTTNSSYVYLITILSFFI